MSKISDRLTKLGQTERTGFGFGARATSTKIPVILVGARIDKPEDAKGLETDLFILAAGSNGAAQTQPVESTDLWGVAVSGGSSENIETATKAGADFVVIESEAAPGSALKDDDLGKGFVIGNDVTEDRSKAIDSGPFDFIVLDGTALTLPMNVGAALDLQEQLARYSRHIFLQVVEVPGQSDLELLRDIGISALIYDSKLAEKIDLPGLRKSIDRLEQRKIKTSAGAVLPRGGETPSPQEVDVDDHDDEDDWE